MYCTLLLAPLREYPEIIIAFLLLTNVSTSYQSHTLTITPASVLLRGIILEFVFFFNLSFMLTLSISFGGFMHILWEYSQLVEHFTICVVNE